MKTKKGVYTAQKTKWIIIATKEDDREVSKDIKISENRFEARKLENIKDSLTKKNLYYSKMWSQTLSP